MSSLRALPVQGRPIGVEDIATDESAVALDRHAPHGDEARVEHSAAQEGSVAADRDLVEHERPASVAHAAADVCPATCDRDA